MELKNRISIAGFVGVCAATLVILLLVSRSQSPRAKEILDTAIDAYVYGSPLVTLDMVRRQQTNVVKPDAEHAPMGQLIKMKGVPSSGNRCCGMPDADTLNTMAWVDVSPEPWIFRIPEMGKRYYIVTMLDGFSEVLAAPSSPSTSGQARTYAITGPGWDGKLPPGVTRVKSTTSLVWIIARISRAGVKGDSVKAEALQDKFSLAPLSSFGKPYSPPFGVFDAELDMRTSVREQVNGFEVKHYFTYLAKLLKANPPKAEDSAKVGRFGDIGLVPGQEFDPGRLDFLDRRTLSSIPKLAQLKLIRRLHDQKSQNGWIYFTSGVGNYGTDYVLRGLVNSLGPGWNKPRDVIYMLAQKEQIGENLNGEKRRYIIHFEPGSLPPAKGAWSLTLYDNEFFPVPNYLNRHALTQADRLVKNPDGSIDFFCTVRFSRLRKRGELAAGSKGGFQPGNASLLAKGNGFFPRGWQLEAAGR